MQVCFGDLARILRTPETEKVNCADRVGIVFGESLLSCGAVSKDEVVGIPSSDKILNVFFEDDEFSQWFSEDLVTLEEKRSSGQSMIGKRLEDIVGDVDIDSPAQSDMKGEFYELVPFWVPLVLFFLFVAIGLFFLLR